MLEALVLVAGLLGTGDTLSGRVADPAGNPVAGATVTVPIASISSQSSSR